MRPGRHDEVTQAAAHSSRGKEDMTEPRYSWQIPEKRAIPLHDLTDDEFAQRLEELMHHLEARQQEAAWPQVEHIDAPSVIRYS
jgi:hypothetical protein